MIVLETVAGLTEREPTNVTISYFEYPLGHMTFSLSVKFLTSLIVHTCHESSPISTNYSCWGGRLHTNAGK